MGKRKMARYFTLFFIFTYLASTQLFSQIGKWKAVYEYNSDSTYFSKLEGDHEYIYQFNEDKTFTTFHLVKNSNDQRIYKNIGKWKIVRDYQMVLYDRSPDPPRPNTIYHDRILKIIKLGEDELVLFGNFGIREEGGVGYWKFIRMK